jgi:hypothetical protein
MHVYSVWEKRYENEKFSYLLWLSYYNVRIAIDDL